MKSRSSSLLWLGCALLALFLGVGCGSRGTQPSAGLEKIRLRLNWFPEMEHGGYYAALVEGYYQEEGLDVEIMPGGPEKPPAPQEVALGAVTFGVSEADYVLLAREQGVDVVSILAPFQKSPICIMVHEKSGIKSLNDLRDVTLALDSEAPYAKYLKPKLPKDLKIVPFTGGVTHFLSGEKTAQQGFAFSEPLLVEKEKATNPTTADPRVLLVSELGYNPYTNVLIAGRETIRNKPELVQKMVRASVRGWQKYLEAPEKANEQIKKVNPVMDLDTLARGAKVVKDFALDATTQQHGFGYMTQERWQQLLTQMEESSVLKPGKVKASEAFDVQFLPKK